jgi:hypothetical protein
MVRQGEDVTSPYLVRNECRIRQPDFSRLKLNEVSWLVAAVSALAKSFRAQLVIELARVMSRL